MDATNRQLTAIDLGDAPDAWATAGFDVHDDHVVLGRTTLRLTGSGAGFEGWTLANVSTAVDGLAPAAERPDRSEPDHRAAHPNGITRIDHVVVRTGDLDRTLAAFEAAGLEVRGGRTTDSYGAPMRQRFLWAGDVIIEVIGPGDEEPRGDEPASLLGLALVAEDLDATSEYLGDLLGAPKPAVQPGRRIAGLRGSTAGISLPVAVMSPHVRPAGGPEVTHG